MMSNKIDIAFSVHDKDGSYSSKIAVAMVSILENTNSEIIFHLLHDDTLSEYNKNFFKKLVNHYNKEIIFYHIKLKKEDFEAIQRLLRFK